jgi:hypothetical protein
MSLSILIDGVERTDWFPTIREVKANPTAAGLHTMTYDPCQGGYCMRHGYKHSVKYNTEDGLRLCNECGVIWAARRKLGLKHGIGDL